MGRTPLSMWRLGRALRATGCATATFGYVAAWQTVDLIVRRLSLRLEQLAGDDCIVIGHSLGGILARAAIASLPAGTRRPRRLIMLGPPNRSPRLARRFEQALWYRLLNGDAGQLLASEPRLAAIPAIGVPCTIIAGTRGIHGKWSPFRDEPNDGLVAVAETTLAGADEVITVPVRHPFMTSDRRVIGMVVERCRRKP
jgi:pimeloyl-ACP methyl ester carboxylesterase